MIHEAVVGSRSPTRRSPTAGNREQGSKWLWPPTRRRIYERDNWRCVWCTRAVGRLSANEHRSLTFAQASIDHVVSRSRGGSNEPSNLITCCKRCNEKRGDRSVSEFAAFLCDPGGALYVTFPESPGRVMRRVRNAQRRRLPSSRKVPEIPE
jgi:5-methylcytosine-specific restriction endonuclease McrA